MLYIFLCQPLIQSMSLIVFRDTGLNHLTMESHAAVTLLHAHTPKEGGYRTHVIALDGQLTARNTLNDILCI